MVCTLASGRISANFHKSGEVSVEVTMWIWSHMPIHNLRRCSNTSYGYWGKTWTWDAVWKVLQHQQKHGGMVGTLASEGFPPLSQIWGTFCCGNGVSVKPYAYPQPEKVLVHLINVYHGHGHKFERFYSLNQSVVAWFTHLHQVRFHPSFPNLEKCLWW